MIRVKYYSPIETVIIIREYSNEHEVKVLQSGVLKIVLPLVAEVPVLAEGDPEGEIIKTPTKTVAIFMGKYIVEVTD